MSHSDHVVAMETVSDERLEGGYRFTRFVGGKTMAEDILIEKANTFEQAVAKAWDLCPSPKERTVLIYHPAPSPVGGEVT